MLNVLGAGNAARCCCSLEAVSLVSSANKHVSGRARMGSWKAELPQLAAEDATVEKAVFFLFATLSLAPPISKSPMDEPMGHFPGK